MARFPPRVVHRDFDTSNIIVDPRNYDVMGVIDFEEVSVWDPAADLLFFGEGESFIEDLLTSYSLPLGPNLDERNVPDEEDPPHLHNVGARERAPEYGGRGVRDAGEQDEGALIIASR